MFLQYIFNKHIEMKKKVYTLLAAIFLLAQVSGQSVFTSVPVVNGKVVFQQFIHIEQDLSADQRYSILYKWGKDNYTGNPLLAGIRFDENNKSITVSSKVELLLPQNNAGVREKLIMNYRFDASITSAGCMLIVRDITYQNPLVKGSSLFPKTFSAEETITSEAISSSASAADKEFKMNVQKGSLYFLNELYNDLNAIFVLNK